MILLSLGGIVALVFLALNLPFTRGIVTAQVNRIFDEVEIPIHFSEITRVLPHVVKVDAVSILDIQGDTVIHASGIKAQYRPLKLFRKKVVVRDVAIRHARVFLMMNDETRKYNISEAFQKKQRPPEFEKKDPKWRIVIHSADLEDVLYRMKDQVSGIELEQDVSSLKVKDFHILLPERLIESGDIELSGAHGSLTLRPRTFPKKQKKKQRAPMKFAFPSVDLERTAFSFHQPADSLWLVAGVDLLKIRTRETDLSGRSLDLKSLELHNTHLAHSFLKELSPDPDSGPNVSGLNLDLKNVLLGRGRTEGRITSLNFALGNGVVMNNMKATLTGDRDQTRIECFLETAESRLELSGEADDGLMDLFSSPENIQLASIACKECRISPLDLARFFPEWTNWPYYVHFSRAPLHINGGMKLRDAKLFIDNLTLQQQRQYRILLDGSLQNPFPLSGASADLKLSVNDLHPDWLGSVLDSIMPRDSTADLSNLSLSAQVSDSLLSPGFSLELKSNLGDAELWGWVDLSSRKYIAGAAFHAMALGALLPVEGLDPITGRAKLKGSGFSPENMDASIALSLDSMGYKDYPLSQAELDLQIQNKRYQGSFTLIDPSLKGSLEATLVSGDSGIRVSAGGEVYARLDSVGPWEDGIALESGIDMQLEKTSDILAAHMLLLNTQIESPIESFSIDRLESSFRTDSNSTRISAESAFLEADLEIALPADQLGDLGEAIRAYTHSFLDSLQFQADTRIHYLPEFHATGKLNDHPVVDLLMEDSILDFGTLEISLHNHLSENRMQANLHVDSVSYGEARAEIVETKIIDSVGRVNLLLQTDQFALLDGPLLNLELAGSVDQGEITGNLSMLDQDSLQVYGLEAAGSYGNKLLHAKIPSKQVILNRHTWYLDKADLLTADLSSGRFYPDLHMRSDSTYVSLYAPDRDSVIHYRLDLESVQLATLMRREMIKGSPEGDISGTIEYHQRENEGRKISAGLVLREARYSSIDFHEINLDGSLSLAEEESYAFELNARLDSATLQASGGKTEGIPLRLRSGFDQLPIRILEPLVEKHVSEVSGKISGHMEINPVEGHNEYNGKLSFEDTRLKVVALNTPFLIPDQHIFLHDGQVELDSFQIMDTLGRALTVDGSIDLQNRETARTDLEIYSSHLQIMSRDPKTKAAFSGNVIVDSRFSIEGPLAQPTVDGKILLSHGTEIYYQHLEDLSISKSEQIVNFVSHQQEEEREEIRISHSHSNLLHSSIETIVEIDPSTLLHFHLRRRIYDMGLQIKGGGILKYNMLDNKQIALAGRYDIGEGEAMLKLTGWPNKAFTISKDGYIRWDGRAENPELKFEAVNQVNTSYINPVDGQRRDAEFNVLLRLSNYLSELDVEFTVNTPDQYIMSIINTMSPEEKMHQAITILLFETIDMPGISSTSDYMAQQVDQIVSAQLNQLTKTTIKGVDISFGLDSYNESTQGGSQESTTNLTYEVGKTFANDRARVELSGRVYDVNEQPGASDVSLHNISFEYRLDSAASKYLKVYNEQSYEDVFEGEVVQTGVGFTYRRRYNALKDIFRRKKKKEGR